jgi:glycerol kinase
MAAGKFRLDAARIHNAGMVTTVAWATADEGLVLGVEGNIISSGSTMVWLGQLLGRDVGELASLARESAATTSELNLVPAFSGLGAPWWQSGVAAQISGLTLGSDASDLARAGFEAIVLQIEDVVYALEQAIENRVDQLRVDGGPTSNVWLMQLLADLSQREISRTDIAELSAIGVAALAAGAGWHAKTRLESTEFFPKLEPKLAENRRSSWAAAVRQVINSATN